MSSLSHIPARFVAVKEETGAVSVLTRNQPPKPDSNTFIVYSLHSEKSAAIDFSLLATGTAGRLRKGQRTGQYTGRPELLRELFPAICDEVEFAPHDTADGVKRDLIRWWKELDAFEERMGQSKIPFERLTTVRQLTDLHRQFAFDSGMNPGCFGTFRRLASMTLEAYKLPALTWIAPPANRPTAYLPSQDCFAQLWNGLKRRWFVALDRWTRAEELLHGDAPRNESEQSLLDNYVRYAAVKSTCVAGEGFPSVAALMNGMPRKVFQQSFETGVMYMGFFPGPHEIRTAFHLSLAGSGWNPEPLLTLMVNFADPKNSRTPFIRDHHTDKSRYVMRGYKGRGRSSPTLVGEWKTSRSAGVIITKLVELTWPLRERVIADMNIAIAAYNAALLDPEQENSVKDLHGKAIALEQMARSPWLYIVRGVVHALDEKSYRANSGSEKLSFLENLVNEVNESNGLKGDGRIPNVKASDFRDAFATFVWRATGGSVLHVMRALGHKSLRSTQVYLDNTSIQDTCTAMYLRTMNALWDGIREDGVVDPTIIAKKARDGTITADERNRLKRYRELSRSRMGTGCKDPFHPPKHVDPNFQADGKKQCGPQRCLLCLVNAVVLPESMPGMAMRMAELNWLKENMPLHNFSTSDLQVEHENLAAALRMNFEADAVNSEIERWTLKIKDGLHRPQIFQAQIWMRQA